MPTPKKRYPRCCRPALKTKRYPPRCCRPALQTKRYPYRCCRPALVRRGLAQRRPRPRPARNGPSYRRSRPTPARNGPHPRAARQRGPGEASPKVVQGAARTAPPRGREGRAARAQETPRSSFGRGDGTGRASRDRGRARRRAPGQGGVVLARACRRGRPAEEGRGVAARQAMQDRAGGRVRKQAPRADSHSTICLHRRRWIILCGGFRFRFMIYGV